MVKYLYSVFVFVVVAIVKLSESCCGSGLFFMVWLLCVYMNFIVDGWASANLMVLAWRHDDYLDQGHLVAKRKKKQKKWKWIWFCDRCDLKVTKTIRVLDGCYTLFFINLNLFKFHYILFIFYFFLKNLKLLIQWFMEWNFNQQYNKWWRKSVWFE